LRDPSDPSYLQPFLTDPPAWQTDGW